MFRQRLKKLMQELNLNQKEVAELTGIGKSSISQYLTGSHEPTHSRQKEIAKALGADENYFFDPMPEVVISDNVGISVAEAAKLIRKSKTFITKGLQQKAFPWGYAVKRGKWSYFINRKKFFEIEGIEPEAVG